jgi:hypothetical protein
MVASYPSIGSLLIMARQPAANRSRRKITLLALIECHTAELEKR